MTEYERGLRDGREIVATWMMERGYATGHGDSIHDLLSKLEGQARDEHLRRAANGEPPPKNPKTSGLLRPELQSCFAPTVSAMVAPRAPIGFGLPVVVSRTV